MFTKVFPAAPRGKGFPLRMSVFHKSAASVMDGAMYAMMNAIQWRLRSHACSRAELDAYLSACAGVSRDAFYKPPPASPLALDGRVLSWPSPVPSGFTGNDTARAILFPCGRDGSAPTVLILHALMSANDIGYRRIAARFNARGWNAVLTHLPFHYSRVPRGHFNGALAITANLPRNGETLRQAVIELRQLMAWLRDRGCSEFGLLGTSYGGWVGSLLAFVEPNFRFISLLQPIVDVEHAIWENPAAGAMRQALAVNGIRPGASRPHAHLTSPIDGVPLTAPERIHLIGGAYDAVSPPHALYRLVEQWNNPRLSIVDQGHFGYAAMREALQSIDLML
jgi:hypothetical protein